MASPAMRKRVGAEPFLFRRAPDGSGFMQCGDCNKVFPAATSDMHDCQRDAKIASSLECHHTIDCAMKEHGQMKSRKRRIAEDSESPGLSDVSGKALGSKRPRDPNLPKKPKTAFFLFMDDFRQKFKNNCQDSKGVSKEGAAAWKTLTEEDRMPYISKYEKLKLQYAIHVARYHNDLKKANEEADSAEVGKIDTTTESFHDFSSEYGETETEDY